MFLNGVFCVKAPLTPLILLQRDTINGQGIEQLTIVENFPLTSLKKLRILTNGNLKKGKCQ